MYFQYFGKRTAMSLLFILLQLSSLAVADTFRFNFPDPQFANYTFYSGDTVMVSWVPKGIIPPQIFLNCSATADVVGHVNSSVVQFQNKASPAQYSVSHTPAQGVHTYCVFGLNDVEQAASGAFHLLDAVEGVGPTTWEANAVISGSSTSNPSQTSSPTTKKTQAAATTTSATDTTSSTARPSDTAATSSGLGTGAIVGVGIGCGIIAIAIAGALFCMTGGRRAQKEQAALRRSQISRPQISASQDIEQQPPMPDLDQTWYKPGLEGQMNTGKSSRGWLRLSEDDAPGTAHEMDFGVGRNQMKNR